MAKDKVKQAPAEVPIEEQDTNDWLQAKKYQFLRKGKTTVRVLSRTGGFHAEAHWQGNVLKTQTAFPDQGKAKRFGRALFKALTNG